MTVKDSMTCAWCGKPLSIAVLTLEWWCEACKKCYGKIKGQEHRHIVGANLLPRDFEAY